MNKPLLSVIIPAYNEETRIRSTITDLKRYFSGWRYPFEIIIVNDGSTDSTSTVVQNFAQNFPELKLVEYRRNRGKGYAVKCGMMAAKGAYRLFMDADNSVKIETVDSFIDDMRREEHDVVIGSIALGESPKIEHNGAHRRILGSLSKFIIRVVATPGIYDTQRGFKLFTERAAKAIFLRQRTERFGFDIELLVIARLHGFSVKERPVAWDNPAGSKVSLASYFNSFAELWNIYTDMLRGVYDPVPAKRSVRRKANLAILFLAQFPVIFSRLIREIRFSGERVRETMRSKTPVPQSIRSDAVRS